MPIDPKALWTSGAIAAATSGTCVGKWEAARISTDSRQLKPGDLFIALKGPNHDAHDFVAEAFNKGAVGAVVSHMPAKCPPEKLVLVANTFYALQDLGKAGRARASAKIIAVTGSVGKTGCKEALRQVLSAQAPSFASAASYNNQWGVPWSLALLPPDAVYGVFEMGMNHAGELAPLSKLARPHIALITGIANVHAAHFASLEDIARAKSEIFQGLEPGGTAVLNGDDTYYEVMRQAAAQVGVKNIARFGRGAGFEAQLEEFSLEAEGSRVRARVLGQPLSYYIGVPGEHWVMNSLAVLLCAGLAGADLAKAAKTFEKLALAEGRGGARQVEFPGGHFTLVDESYNASPVAMEAAIKVLAARQPARGGSRVLVLGDMKELGDKASEIHAGLARPILNSGVGRVYACGELMRYLKEALPEGLCHGWALTSGELASQVAAEIRDGDIVTVKGSHSMMMEKVVQALLALQPVLVPSKSSATR
ncbi:MAG: UDP-N-acetylmuramoyl-tripeptide--D-alanyl-D-alanine ligase [Proteobacteria bacterium]|nr:UDP-N-acetylmuramoyl-tripeptide--D-alanyl-D-alanine ligase [Pseudomonadota bacterium]